MEAPVGESVGLLHKESSPGTLEFSTESPTMRHEIHTYSALLRQIHNDLRVQHPEWIQPNGDSPMCDSYEARLMELLVGSIGSGPSETTAVSDSAFEYGRTRI
jgi:hypothetical protein